jgi:hypothetical protein
MPQKDWSPGNWHSLVIFYPLENKSHRKTKYRWYIVVTKDGNIKSVIPAMWDGKVFRDVENEVVNHITHWGNFPTHPDLMKDRRW